MRAIVAMVGKDLRLLVRDPMGFFFTFVFPLVFAIFFGTLFSGDGSETRALPIAVVDEDHTTESRAFAARLDTLAEFETRAMTRAEAVEAVRLGRRIAYVALPPGFGEARRQLFRGAGPEVEIGLDPSRQAEGAMLQGLLSQYLSDQMQQLFSDRGAMRRQLQGSMAGLDSAADMPAPQRTSLRRFLGEAERFFGEGAADTASAGGPGWQPARFKTTEVTRVRRGPRNAYEVSFPQGVLWAILNGAYGFALGLVGERTRGTLVRLRMAPLSRTRILAAKAAAAMLSVTLVSTIVLMVGAAVFGVRPNSLPLLALAVLSTGAGMVGIMMLISVISASQRGVSGMGWAVMMAMSMTGGAMVPLFAMPAWMQAASMASPVRWAIIGLEGAIWRGFTPAQMALPCGILLGLGALGFGIGARVFRWTEK